MKPIQLASRSNMPEDGLDLDTKVRDMLKPRPNESLWAAAKRIMVAPHGNPVWRVAAALLAVSANPWTSMRKAAKAARRLDVLYRVCGRCSACGHKIEVDTPLAYLTLTRADVRGILDMHEVNCPEARALGRSLGRSVVHKRLA